MLRVVLLAVAFAAIAVFLVARAGDDPLPAGVPVVPTPPGPAGEDTSPLPDPFAWDPEREDEFARRAAAGNAHALYAFSPGGVVATAERTARWRERVERAADEAEMDADVLEGLVFLESGGPRGRAGAGKPGERRRAHADPGRDGPEPARDARRRPGRARGSRG